MAATDVLLPAAAATNPAPHTKPGNTDDGFDPKRHLNFTPPSRVHTMEDIGLPADTGVSPIAVSEPFPLFTPEAVMRMRGEVLSKEVLSNCAYSSTLAQAQLRGYADKYAPFVYAAWKHPETVQIISQVAGLDLALQFDYEIGHVNLSARIMPEQAASSSSSATIPGDDEPIVGWHTDSYPFVCVVMLSDCAGMQGGETELRCGDGRGTLKVRAPQMGHAIILQGRYIPHRALRSSESSAERITMVTSFRPRDPLARDDTVLTTVRPVSDLRALYGQFAAYRLEALAQRVRRQLGELEMAARADGWEEKQEKQEEGGRLDARRLRVSLAELRRFLEETEREIVDEEEVVRGKVQGGLEGGWMDG